MEEQSSQENVESQQGEPSRETLVQKCKTLLAIAQKAKIARDEALEERTKLQKEIDVSKNAYKTAEDIMAALTEQKLKLAMDIDTLKQEKATFANQLRVLNSEKETFEVEAESFKRQYNRLLSENEDLIGELQIRERSESQLLNDIKKLHENNESVKILCTNVTQEKLHLEEELEKLSRRMEEMLAERDAWNRELGPRLGSEHVDLKTLVAFIDDSPSSLAERDTKNRQDHVSDDGNILLATIQVENESLQKEVDSLKDKIQKLMSDLETANVDRDQMMSNLEDVRVETKTLIENVEKLNEEVDLAKEEKTKSEAALTKVIESKNEEIDSLLKELSKNKVYVNELLSSLETHMDNSSKYNELNSAYLERSEELLKHKEDNSTLKKRLEELSSAQDDLKTGGGSGNVDCNVLVILKEGIVSNLTDMADTMPEYSKEFLNKLNAILEGADCKGEVGADIFVHYFNECLSQLKISLKENEILSKEVDHLNNSVKELENLVATHNKDCEQLRSEVEELSSDSNRLLHDLGNLRHENSLRVSEIGELMVCLKSRDKEIDELKENYNRLEFENNEVIMELSSKLADSNNNVVQMGEINKELEIKCESILKDAQSEANKQLVAVREELDLAKNALSMLQTDLENCQKALLAKSEEIASLLLRLSDDESKEKNLESVKSEMERYKHESELLNAQLTESNDTITKQTEDLKHMKRMLEEGSSLKIETEKKLDALELNFSCLKDAFQMQSLELEKTVEKLKGTELQSAADNEKLVVRLEEVEKELRVAMNASAELEKVQKVVEEKALVEEQLFQLKGIQQTTMEELENTKQLLNESHSGRKHMQETEKTLKRTIEELTQAQERLLVENASINKELEDLKTELESKAEELECSKKRLTEYGCEKEVVRKLELELKCTSDELDKVKDTKLQVEEELLQIREASRMAEVSVEQRVSELESALSEKETKLRSTMKKLEESEALIASVTEERNSLLSKVTSMENELSLLQENQELTKQLQEDIELLKTEMESQKKIARDELEEKQRASKEIEQLSENVQCLQSENEVLREKFAEQSRTMNDEIKKKKDEISKLLNEIEEAKEMSNFKKMELDEVNCIWAGRLHSIKVNLHSLVKCIHELGRQASDLQSMFLEELKSLKNVIETKAEKAVEESMAEAKKELLDEMHRMNDVLKDRGEAIAKLQDVLTETEGKVEALSSQNAEFSNEQIKLKSELKTKDEKLATNESSLRELEAELGRLRELKETVPESDALSTSTISRTEDHMRFKEVDDSIEEKYLKLRHVAVKLKKKVSELTQSLELEKNKVSPDKTEFMEKIQQLSSAAKNAQKVQESYDKTLDELEEAKKQNSTMSLALKELNGNVETLTRQISTLESSNANIPLMHKQVESLNNSIKELKSDVTRLEMEKRVEGMKYEESKKQCAALESKVESLSQALDQAVQQGRSNNVLELEMKNYEKIVSDLTAQLNSEKQRLANTEKECASINLVKNGLEEQIALLEKQVIAEESRNANLQEQILSMREKTSAGQRQIDEMSSTLCDVKRELQHAKNLGEQQALEMSTLTSEFSRKEMDLQSKIESFTAHIQSLETSLVTTKQELQTSNSEKEHLREEFESYRLRAQSTLARQKGDSISQGEKEVREQFDKLKKELDGAREKMENNQTEIETLNNKLSSLQLEKARSDKRYEDMTKALHQKITDYDTLNTEYRAFKFSSETLLQNMKIEFEERERNLKEESRTLKDLVDALNEKIDREMKESCLGIEARNNNGGNSSLFESQQPLENLPSLQEREDGEGSESVPPPMSNFRRLSNLVPLDILLNNPIDDENRIPVLQEQIEKLHSELNSYEVRVKHLASLLSEAEKDSARSSQQNAVLKEELRRLERSLQREPHIANSEYLKNVIFKFLVLQNGDERTRLVPVLDTILKLSPEETSRLTAVAKGESATWGSYLHSWTGL